MNRTVLITGATGGIGLAIAEAFAENRDRVVIHYHTQKEKALELVSRLDCESMAVCCDISNPLEVERMFRDIQSRFGDVDVLVNNAGIAQQKLMSDITIDDWDHMFDVNVRGCFLCSKSALPSMISKKYGKIINISSIWGICGASCEVHYSSAKAAVIGLTKALAREVGPSGITVNCICPGVIDTDMNSHLDDETLRELSDTSALCRIGKPSDIAQSVLFLSSTAADFITAQVIGVDGGFI